MHAGHSKAEDRDQRDGPAGRAHAPSSVAVQAEHAGELGSAAVDFMNQNAQADSACITIFQPPKANTLLHSPIYLFHGSSDSEPYMLYRHLFGRYTINFSGVWRTAVMDDFGGLVLLPCRRGPAAPNRGPHDYWQETRQGSPTIHYEPAGWDSSNGDKTDAKS